MNITIYSKDNCSFCETAINAASTLEATVTIKKVDESAEYFSELQSLVPGVRSVPQIFIDDNHLGGCKAFLQWINLTEGGTKQTIIKSVVQPVEE